METRIPKLNSAPDAKDFGKIATPEQLRKLEIRASAHDHAYEILNGRGDIDSALKVGFKLQFCHEAIAASKL